MGKNLYQGFNKEDVRHALAEAERDLIEKEKEKKIKGKPFKRNITDYSKWAGAGRKNAVRVVYPGDDVVYCYIKKELLKKSEALEVYNAMPKPKPDEDLGEYICGGKCQFGCQ